MKNGLAPKIIAGVLVLAGGFALYKYFTKKPDDGATKPSDTQTGGDTTTGAGSGPKNDDKFPLKKGSSGPKVKQLQKYIQAKDPKALPKYGADGSWGKETEDALYRYYFTLITIKDGKISVDSQAQLDRIKDASKPLYTPGKPLVYAYQQQPKTTTPFSTF